MQTVIVTGGNGQVGQSLQELCKEKMPNAQFLFTDHTELDITNKRAVNAYFKKHKPSWCINCAAYTAVDKAEEAVAACTAVNVRGAKNLAEACTAHGSKMVHISSDYVYHNKENAPMTEESVQTPKGVYSKTKLRGDRAALKGCKETVILRTSWVYAHVGHNFVKTMRRLGSERDALNVVFDQVGAPTYALDIADTILSICTKIDAGEVDVAEAYGVFNYANEGVTSWYDFALATFDISGIDCKVSPIRSAQYPTPAARPTYSVMDKAKIKATYGFDIPHWRDALKRCIVRLNEEVPA